MFTVVSYNIHGGKDYFWRNRLTEMADTLKSLDADVIALQEVHQNSRFGCQADYLAEILGGHSAFAPALPVADGAYGLALFSRFPLVRTASRALPARREPRVLQQAKINWNGRIVDVWNTHLSLDRNSRQTQLAILRQLVHTSCTSPLILLGDFNTAEPSLPLKDCARETGQDHWPTLVAFAKRVDFVFVSSAWQVASYDVLNVRWSDHYPVRVSVRLMEPPTPEG